ncbi:uncharacterized protein F4822DRAFT_434190 [Hypoxylon trugodes]|uniref:uncharacterized protein n=1 Tax=Hypoxylon trugodes TaxID=326681 RepID=UPI002190CB1D|nr:uncharacterized protein F4822DRAFT_434190 [Hypoxylon trugodes]KAI1384251.1 hypothetical protein F4822DRAFT_434190 [Hypoxylon trugodes]
MKSAENELTFLIVEALTMSAFTPEQIQYLEEHIDETLVPSIFISNGICLGAATISVVLRFFSRRLSGSGLDKDDYCLFLSYVLYVGYVASLNTITQFGYGRHVILVTDFRKFSILSLVTMSFYVFGMACVKLSIIFLYHRIFPGKRFRNVLIVIAGIVSSWVFAAFFASIFSCYPVEKSWDSSIPGKCIDYGTVTLAIGIINVLLDFLILGTPMHRLWKLHMSTRRKVLLSGAFATGCIACFVSIARLFYARKESMSSTSNVTMSDGEQTSIYDPSWTDVWPGILSGLEICTGIVACCTITYRPLIEKFFLSPSGEKSDVSQGSWNKISVNQEVTVMDNSQANLTHTEDNEESRAWELRARGLDGRWE